MERIIQKMQDEYNSKYCEKCKCQHHVKLTLVKLSVFYKFSDDACDEFENEVVDAVTHRLNTAGIPVTRL